MTGLPAPAAASGRGLAGKVALVTGAGGFIGGALVRRLRAAGAVVHGLSRRPRRDGDGCDRWWQSGLGRVEDARRVLDQAGPDLVFHLAGLTAAARGRELVLPMLASDLIAPVNLLVAAAERPGLRLVFAGSLEEPSPGAGWPVPASPYAAAKLAAGCYARMFHALYGTPVVWLRLFMAYGPTQADTRKLVPYVTLSLLRGEPPLLSSGARLVDWIFVDDVVDAFLAAAVADGVEGRTLDVGSGELVAVRTVVEQLARIAGRGVAPRFGAVPDRPLERECAADVAATAASLGWRPRTPLQEGLERTVEWYRRHGGAVPAPPGGGTA